MLQLVDVVLELDAFFVEGVVFGEEQVAGLARLLEVEGVALDEGVDVVEEGVAEVLEVEGGGGGEIEELGLLFNELLVLGEFVLVGLESVDDGIFFF